MTRAPPSPPALPEEISLDLWLSFTSPRIKAAVCSYGPGPHESNFIDHLESYRHPLNTKCRWKGHRVGKCLLAGEIEGGIIGAPHQTVMKLLQLVLINIYVRSQWDSLQPTGIEANTDVPLNNKYRKLFAKETRFYCVYDEFRWCFEAQSSFLAP